MAETVVFFLGDEGEPLFLVDVPRLCEHVVGPEHELLVATASSETNTLIDEAGTPPQAARPRFGPEEAEFCACFTSLHPTYGAHDFTVHPRHSASLSPGLLVVA